MRFLNLLHRESESENRLNSDENCLYFITRFFKPLPQKIHPACPKKRSTRHNDQCLDVLESIC